ncbi:hypothetical protein DFH09DRAFT_1128501 [Mycena vulgaris]|nr:hypothetical protein DFH09DRAFT_1128501 [Mycena vulgaris]
MSSPVNNPHDSDSSRETTPESTNALENTTADAGSGLVDYHGEVRRFLEANRGVSFTKGTMDAYATYLTDPHISSTVLEALLEDLTSRADSESDAALVEARIIIKTLGMPAFWRELSKHVQRMSTWAWRSEPQWHNSRNINVEPRSQLRIQRWTAKLISRLMLRESMLFVILDTIDQSTLHLIHALARILPLKKSPIPLISNAAAPHAYSSRGTVGIASGVRAGSVPTGYLHPEFPPCLFLLFLLYESTSWMTVMWRFASGRFENWQTSYLVFARGMLFSR